MDSLTVAQAVSAVETAQAGKSITPLLVETLMGEHDVRAELLTAAPVKTAAAHKDIAIYKVSKSNVILPTTGQTYINMVRASATQLGASEKSVNDYTVGESYYQHTNVYPVCESKKDASKKYLYCIYKDTASPVYIKGGQELTKEEVAVYLTAGEAKKLLGSKPQVTENVTHGITHNVTVRTVSMGNVISLQKA